MWGAEFEPGVFSGSMWGTESQPGCLVAVDVGTVSTRMSSGSRWGTESEPGCLVTVFGVQSLNPGV
jgi:hypothetical protein